MGSTKQVPRLGKHGVGLSDIPRLKGYQRTDVVLGGRAPKDFIYLSTSRKHECAYIAKKPVRDHTGPRECVTEKLIADIGRMLPLRVAEGQIARLNRDRENPDVRFLSRYFLQPRQRLVHGIELVARALDVGQDEVEQEVHKRKVERHFYTLDLVDEALSLVASGVQRMTQDAMHQRLRAGLARMLAFDALVGANDRHPENWGIIENVMTGEVIGFAPVFDTARGLLLHYSDGELESQEHKEGRTFVERYAEGSKPLIGVPGEAKSNHFDLIEYMATAEAGRFGQPVRQIIQAFRPEDTARMLHQNFWRLLSPVRLRLIEQLLRYRHDRLMEIVGLR